MAIAFDVNLNSDRVNSIGNVYGDWNDVNVVPMMNWTTTMWTMMTLMMMTMTIDGVDVDGVRVNHDLIAMTMNRVRFRDIFVNFYHFCVDNRYDDCMMYDRVIDCGCDCASIHAVDMQVVFVVISIGFSLRLNASIYPDSV